MQKRFKSLDAFRGLCAISVVVFHMDVMGSFTEWEFFKGSDIFVEFFFVLSGFVLAHGYGNKENLNFTSFAKARFFRLYPLHFVMLIVMLAIEIGKLIAYNHANISFNNIPFTGVNSIKEIIPNLLLIQSWTTLTDPSSFNYPSWSISIEFYMYFLLFISIIFFRKHKVLCWLLISLIMIYLLQFDSGIIRNEVVRGLACFFGGAFIYKFYTKISHIQIPQTAGTFIEILLLFGIYFIVQSDLENRQLIAILTFFVVVLFFAFESGYVSSLFKKVPFQNIGKLSYSIYMIHAAFLFCLVSIMIVVQKITHIEIVPVIDGIRTMTTGSVILNNLISLLIIGIVVILSSISYKHIELKGQKFGKRFFSQHTFNEKHSRH